MPAAQKRIGAVMTVFSSFFEKRLYKKTIKVKKRIIIMS